MSRARATALALVNWKGVFYERYLLDRHVTALEGENGAGKTTVMIAAYVVLLPDLSRLRFTNLGETAATGGDRGIWGRLGDPARPSYAAMEIRLPNGEHLVAGVHLERKTEPSLELRPFVVTGLTLDGSLKDVLLRDVGDSHEVPELHEVREAVERRGGTMHLCASAKEYFGMLFDRGVLPLRLSTEEERTKMHDMLRTSMTGGISRALTSELRAFLLKEESGLADTVTRMRANLDACRRTRAEVAEARVLERELAGVFESARAMFRSAVTAARRDLERARRTERVAAEEHASVLREIALLDDANHAREKRKKELHEELEAARAFVTEATERRSRAEAAQALVERVARQREEADHATTTADGAQATRAQAEARRAEAMTARDRAHDALQRAARGLGDRQAGLDEIHRRAHAHRRAVERLGDARRWLDEPTLDAGALAGRMARLQEELSGLDERRAERDRRDALRRVHDEDRARAEAARARLEAILTEDDPELRARDGEEPHGHARRLLTRFGELRALAERRDDLANDAERAAAFAKHARDIRARAVALGLDREGRLSSAGVDREAAQSEERGRALDRKLALGRRDAQDALAASAAARDEAERFEQDAGGWSALEAAAKRLEAHMGTPMKTTADVARARSRLADERERHVAEMAARTKIRDAFVVQAEGFEGAAGVPHELLALRDALDADLLAARFENASLDEARWFEAALGPLAHALVVPDPAAAAEALAERADVPATVWFVAEDDVARVRERVEAHPRGEGTVDVVVRDAAAIRVSRVPAIPSIGKAARERQAALLREKAAAEEEAMGLLREALDRTDRAIADADRLLLDAARFDAGDPTERAARAREAERDAAERAAEAERAITETTRALDDERRRFDELRALLPHAHLLDAPELEAREKAATAQSERAERAMRLVERGRADHGALAELLDALRHVPTADDTDDASRRSLDERRDRVARAIDAIRDVLEEPEALTYADDGRALAETNALGAALEAQLESAKAEASAADAALREVEATWEDAVRTWQAADAIRKAACAEHERLARELDAVGGSHAAAEDLLRLDERLANARHDGDAAEAQLVELRATEAVDVERQRQAEARRREAEARLERAKHAALPTEAAWATLEREAAERGVSLGAWISDADATSDADGTEARAHARAERAVLVDRLAKARGGADTEARVRAAFDGGVDEPSAFLHAWLAAREWTSRRLPVPLEANGDPGDALDKLRTDLASLEGRIGIHETQLRGTSEDVARGIDVHLRKTAARVRRLNQELASLGFGNVSAIRIQIRRVERMDLVLSALHGGEMQELLFQSNLPFEEALAEIFRRYGGGSRSGASRLLDYREYLELLVEIQRRGGTDWEPASPTRLSTGEAIGVGAALMMVILTEWERDANLLRSDRGTGTLRFLFLDEANRLSGDNLAVLFDLCRTLDLQLLVAAPEVARAHGNTTYRLVRRVDDAGREEVIVSGRRTVRDPETAPVDPAPGPAS